MSAIYGVAYTLHINDFTPSGSVFMFAPGTLSRGVVVLARHFSEYAVMAVGATWHPRGHCPTWDDATECRCMLGGEA